MLPLGDSPGRSVRNQLEQQTPAVCLSYEKTRGLEDRHVVSSLERHVPLHGSTDNALEPNNAQTVRRTTQSISSSTLVTNTVMVVKPDTVVSPTSNTIAQDGRLADTVPLKGPVNIISHDQSTCMVSTTCRMYTAKVKLFKDWLHLQTSPVCSTASVPGFLLKKFKDAAHHPLLKVTSDSRCVSRYKPLTWAFYYYTHPEFSSWQA